MKHQSALRWLITLIGLLALFAAGMGLFYQTPGEPYAYTNHRGERATINGKGCISMTRSAPPPSSKPTT